MMRFLSLFGALLVCVPSHAASDALGLTVKIRVVDTAGAPVPGAVIRSPVEGLRHRVNRETGEWSATSLYPQDGPFEVPFASGDDHLFDVSAAGYVSRLFQYEVHPRRNLVVITLAQMTEVHPHYRSVLQPMSPTDLPIPPMSFSIADMERLGDLRNTDPRLAAAFSAHLLSQGVTQADEAVEWAELAMDAARGEMYGPAFVEITDQMYRVRAIALNLQWQTLELARLQGDGDWDEAEAARVAAAEVAEEWVSWIGVTGAEPDLAQVLCNSASEAPIRCRL